MWFIFEMLETLWEKGKIVIFLSKCVQKPSTKEQRLFDTGSSPIVFLPACLYSEQITELTDKVGILLCMVCSCL